MAISISLRSIQGERVRPSFVQILVEVEDSLDVCCVLRTLTFSKKFETREKFFFHF